MTAFLLCSVMGMVTGAVSYYLAELSWRNMALVSLWWLNGAATVIVALTATSYQWP